jgi:hypothetical protein
VASIHRESEKAHSRKLVVASPATNIPFYIALRAVSLCTPAAFCRPIDTPAARICYEELQVVAAELPEISGTPIRATMSSSGGGGSGGRSWSTSSSH